MWRQKPSAPSRRSLSPQTSSLYQPFVIANTSPQFLPILNYLFKMSMKAVVYQKPFTLKVEDVPKPKIEHPDDIIVKITTSAICGSDLHMYVRSHVKRLCDF